MPYICLVPKFNIYFLFDDDWDYCQHKINLSHVINSFVLWKSLIIECPMCDAGKFVLTWWLNSCGVDFEEVSSSLTNCRLTTPTSSSFLIGNELPSKQASFNNALDLWHVFSPFTLIRWYIWRGFLAIFWCTCMYLRASVGTVLIFQFSPGFGTEASVPAVPRYRFWYLGSGSYFSIPGFWYKVSGDY